LHLDEWKVSHFDHPIGLLLGGVGDGKPSLLFSHSFFVRGFVAADEASPHPIFLATPSPVFIYSGFVAGRVHVPPCSAYVIEHFFACDMSGMTWTHHRSPAAIYPPTPQVRRRRTVTAELRDPGAPRGLPNVYIK
jgi:hypothetical protein